MRQDGRPLPRLFVESPLAAGAAVPLAAGQRHYLARVLRLEQGAPLLLFNGCDGEWRARLEGEAALACRLARPQSDGAGPSLPGPSLLGPLLLFAPPRKERLRFLVEKATELGAAALLPVWTRRCRPGAVAPARLRAWAIAAAEQCGRLDVPAIAAPQPLMEALASWPPRRPLLLCQPGAATPVARALDADCAADCAVAVGPEGGFDAAERAALTALPMAVPVSLGPHILRSETACLAALAAWQAWQAGRRAASFPAGRGRAAPAPKR